MMLARADSDAQVWALISKSLNDPLAEIEERAKLLAKWNSIQYEQRLLETPLA